jgi:hypothetical protein
MAGLVFVAELHIPTPMPSIPDVVGLHDARLGELSHEAHYVVCLRTLQLLMIYWRGIGWILTALEQKYKGVKDTDPGAANVDPYSEVALSDRKMIKRLLRHVESSNNKNHNGVVDGTQDSSKSPFRHYSSVFFGAAIIVPGLPSHSYWNCRGGHNKLSYKENGHRH